ncbi:MAG TPA: glutathione transferase GstA [Myxococcales bacterium]|nr:glutathione transferase GstA [Myxococcales bacterium]
MKLVYFPGACSFAPHVALREAGLPFTLVLYDRATHQLDAGGALEDVNDKGYVPVLELDDGERLTEAAVILQYIADQRPETGLAPPAGTMARYRLQEWLNFIATEIHKSYWPLFHGPEVEKPTARERLDRRFSWTQEKIAGRSFVMGDTFTVADAYLLTVVNWMRPAGLDPGKWPGLKDYRARLAQRPSVRAALEAEGLLKRG